MQKRAFLLFVLLLIFWIVISGSINLEHIIFGIFLSLLVVLFWEGTKTKQAERLHIRELLAFGHFILLLIGYVVKSNIAVIKNLLFSDLSSRSIFLELEPGLESEWGRVLLATCITITPGTITIDFNPKSNIFTVHGLTIEMGTSLYYWSLITEIRHLEIMLKRRES